MNNVYIVHWNYWSHRKKELVYNTYLKHLHFFLLPCLRRSRQKLTETYIFLPYSHHTHISHNFYKSQFTLYSAFAHFKTVQSNSTAMMLLIFIYFSFLSIKSHEITSVIKIQITHLWQYPWNVYDTDVSLLWNSVCRATEWKFNLWICNSYVIWFKQYHSVTYYYTDKWSQRLLDPDLWGRAGGSCKLRLKREYKHCAVMRKWLNM